MKRLIPDNRGFTLLELTMIITLIGILAATVLPRFDIDTFRDDTEVSRFISHLRYAQHRSMATGGGWNISFTTNSYSLADNAGTARSFPDGDSTINVTGISSTRNPLYFNYLGVPVNAADNPTGSTTITIGGQNITLVQNTGGITGL
jgi:prepilin-type N-terminal cleavage/methylation domain-containing protein